MNPNHVSAAVGGFVEIEASDARMLFNDGVNIRYYPDGEPVPAKNQLHIEFEDNSSIVCTVQMYGGLLAYHEGKTTTSISYSQTKAVPADR